MGLLSRFRRRRRCDDYVGRHRPGSWGELALPPIDPAPPAAAPVASDVRPITTAPAPAVVEAPVAVAPPIEPPVAVPMPPDEPVPAAAAPNVAIAARQRVRLGFADGSSVDIEDGSSESDALTRTASRLLGD